MHIIMSNYCITSGSGKDFSFKKETDGSYFIVATKLLFKHSMTPAWGQKCEM